MNIYGKPKAGKSFAALGMAEAIASGKPEWLGFQVLTHGPVCYLQVDTPRGEWANRIITMNEHGMDTTNIYVEDMYLGKKYPYNILDPEVFKDLKENIARIKPVVVFIDTIREIHETDENDSTNMRNVITQLVAACMPAAVVLLSHSRKDSIATATMGADLMNDQRGSSYLTGRMDTIIKMNTNNDHATSMEFRGRSVGRGRIEVNQDEETGFIVLDGKDNEYWTLLRETVDVLVKENEKLPSVKSMQEEVSKKTTYKKDRQIQTDINTYLVELGLKAKKAKLRKDPKN